MRSVSSDCRRRRIKCQEFRFDVFLFAEFVGEEGKRFSFESENDSEFFGRSVSDVLYQYIERGRVFDFFEVFEYVLRVHGSSLLHGKG